MGCCSSNGNLEYIATKIDNTSSTNQQAFVRKMSNIREQYTVVKCLGSGNFGSTYLVKDKRSGSERVAKELIKTLMNENVINQLEAELLLLKDLVIVIQNHPCVLKIYEIIETSTRIYIISEYLSGGILYEKYSSSTQISERLAAKHFTDIALALNCIEKFKIIHRDLKPTNLLFESDAPDAHVKMIDFGISILQKQQSFYTDSVQYMAPEVIKGTPSIKSDIWSAGVILYSMLAGVLPYEGDNHEKTAHSIMTTQPDYNYKAWATISPEAISLVQRMLSKNPKVRPSAEQLLSDPWLQAFNRNTLRDTAFATEVHEKLIVLNVWFIQASINLEKSVFSFISNQVLSSKDIKKLKDMFKSLDKDGSGTLSMIELNSGYDSIGLPPPAGIIDLVKKLDTDESGTIDYYEFLKGSEEWTKILMKKELDYAAKKYAKGSDAKLSLDELKGTIPEIKGTEWYDWLTAADKNGDGFITLEELKVYLSVKLGI